MASGCGAANIASYFVLADSGCAAPFVPTCCCVVSVTLLRGVRVALFVVTKEDRCRHPAVALVKVFAVNDGLQDLCSSNVFIIRVHKTR